MASRHKQHKAVKYLLEKGAVPTMRDLMLDTCLHLAVKNGDVETVKVIMDVSCAPSETYITIIRNSKIYNPTSSTTRTEFQFENKHGTF